MAENNPRNGDREGPLDRERVIGLLFLSSHFVLCSTERPRSVQQKRPRAKAFARSRRSSCFFSRLTASISPILLLYNRVLIPLFSGLPFLKLLLVADAYTAADSCSCNSCLHLVLLAMPGTIVAPRGYGGVGASATTAHIIKVSPH